MLNNPNGVAPGTEFEQPTWRTPAQLDQARWRLLGDFMEDVTNRLQRIEQLLEQAVAESPEPPPRRRRRTKVDEA